MWSVRFLERFSKLPAYRLNFTFTFLSKSYYRSGPGCSKLTSLVNVSLKFQTLISPTCKYFLSKKFVKLLQCKSFSHFFNKNFSVFGYKVVKQLTRWPLNELAKLTMLWTTGPRLLLRSRVALFVIKHTFCLGPSNFIAWIITRANVLPILKL